MICAGYSGILPAIQKVKTKRPDIVVITAPIWDDPDMMAKYIDLAFDTDWLKRGESIPEKAKKMGAKTFIHSPNTERTPPFSVPIAQCRM